MGQHASLDRKDKTDEKNKFFCNLCSVDCDNHHNYLSHKKGKAHQSRSNGVSVRPSDSVDKDRGTKAFKCGLCVSDHEGLDLLKSHLQSETHRKRMAEFQAKWHLVSREDQKTLQETATFFCDLCQLDCSGFDSFHNHSESQQHRRRLKKSAKTIIRRPNECGLCQVMSSTEEGLKSHLNSPNHHRRLNATRIHWRKLSVAQQAQMPHDTFYCSLCNVDCQSFHNYVAHSASRIHKGKLRQPSTDVPEVSIDKETHSKEAKVSKKREPIEQAVVQEKITQKLQKPGEQHQTKIESLLTSSRRLRDLLSDRIDQTQEKLTAKLQLFYQESHDEPIRSELKREIIQLNDESENLKRKRQKLMTDFNKIRQMSK